MATIQAHPRLIESLSELRRQWRFHKLLEGILLTLAGAAFVLAGVVTTDNLLHLDKSGRLVLACLLWGTLAVGVIGLVVRRWLEDRRDDFFAVLVEERHPELRNQLINALQLGRGNHNGFSPRLIEAIVNDAVNTTSDMDMSRSVDSRPAWRAAALALLALLVIAGYAAAFGPRFSNGLARVLRPAADIAPYTETTVLEESIQPGSTRVPEGTAIVFKARVTGKVPAEGQVVRLLRQDDGERRQTTVMTTDETTSDGFRSPAVQAAESFDYYIQAGDGRSARHHVEVVKRPDVQALTVAYALPAYTGAPPQSAADSNGEISAIPGTRVTVQVRATKPLSEASFLVNLGKTKEARMLEKSADALTWQTSFVIWEKDRDTAPVRGVRDRIIPAPATYQIRLVDTDGYQNADPLSRPIALVRDQAPTVAIPSPGRDLLARPEETMRLTVQAQDDYGIGSVHLWYRVNDSVPQSLAELPHQAGPPRREVTDAYEIKLATLCARHPELKNGGTVQYWATVTDRNTLTGPGKGESRRFSIYVTTPEKTTENLDLKIDDYAQALEELVLLQRQNRGQTHAGKPFDELVKRQTAIRKKTYLLARVMDRDALPVATMVQELDALFGGLMAEAVKLLESGRDATDTTKADTFRTRSLPVQDQIIARLQEMLARLQRNEQAKQALRKLEKKDKASHKKITDTLTQMIRDLDQMLKDQTQVASKFERLPKKPVDELKEDKLNDALRNLDDFQKKWEKWARGTVNEMTKLPTGFVDDFKLRKDVNKVFEEIEKAATRAKAEKIEVSLEDLGAGLATKMKEDLEMWMPDSPDSAKWVLEEPLDKKPMQIPEMPLPKALEDMIGDLLQKADEFDQDADDVTSAWGDNLDQAGWGVSDGPISTFSAKGKTGNDLPNNMEVSGRSGDGRRGKSSGQMVGDTARGLQGRKTPARVGNERYEPGQIKQEGDQDPNGATGGGKKAGAGRKGLQGGTPPDMVRDMGRLSQKQAGLREKAEQIAKKLDTLGIPSARLRQSIRLMQGAEKDIQDRRYDDAARRRKVALQSLRSAFGDIDHTTATKVSHARELPPALRKELLQGADEGYPPGYEALLKSYFKTLSTAEK
jgi:hypothetical protein